MGFSKRSMLWTLGLSLAGVSPLLEAADADPPGSGPTGTEAPVPAEQHVQAWVGAIDTNDHWRRDDVSSGGSLDGGIGTLPYLGGAGQRLRGERLQVGYEGGGLVAWKNDSTRFFATNGSATVEIDNTLYSIELFLGGVLSVRPAPWLRVFAAAGPTVAYAHLSDDDGQDAAAGTSAAVTSGSGGNAFSLTLYGRAGFEFETRRGFTFGAHLRYAPHEFDFDDGGRLELDSVQYFVSLGQRL